MKRWKLVFAAVCVLLLCACGSKKQVNGRVLAFENGILTVQTEKGESYDFLVEDLKTTIFGLVGYENHEPLDSNCMVQVTWERTQGQRIAEHIWVNARLRQNVMQLSDGMPIDIWEHNGWREYCLEDGTALLMEEMPVGPDDNARWNELLYYEVFPEAAQQGILDYYSKMGLRYNIASLLEDAWLVYDFSEVYNTKVVGQHVWVETWNDRIICCQLNLTIPQERTNGYGESFCEGAVFDRETGEQISNYDLFVLTPEKLEDYLLDQLDHDGTLDRESIRLNLKPEQIVLRRDGGIDFFLADRTEGDYRGMLQIGLLPEQAREILKPWAIIEPENNS